MPRKKSPKSRKKFRPQKRLRMLQSLKPSRRNSRKILMSRARSLTARRREIL